MMKVSVFGFPFGILYSSSIFCGLPASGWFVFEFLCEEQRARKNLDSCIRSVMEYLIPGIVCLVVVGYLIFRRKNRKEPQDAYVCDVCGEKECICHKEQKG
jgi:hypothetical protein